MFTTMTGYEEGLVAYYPFDQRSGNIVFDRSSNSLNGVVIGEGIWIQLSPSNYIAPRIRAVYGLNVEIGDTTAPFVRGDSLPAESMSITKIIDFFEIYFSEDMNPISVSNSSNYMLYAAGRNSIFKTGDDEYYTILVNYSTGTTASCMIVDGPLQPGIYTFIIRSNLTDVGNNKLLANYVKRFLVDGVQYYVNEERNNNSIRNATSLAQLHISLSDGSFTAGTGINIVAAPNYLLSTKLNGDIYDDIVVISDSGYINS